MLGVGISVSRLCSVTLLSCFDPLRPAKRSFYAVRSLVAWYGSVVLLRVPHPLSVMASWPPNPYLTRSDSICCPGDCTRLLNAWLAAQRELTDEIDPVEDVYAHGEWDPKDPAQVRP